MKCLYIYGNMLSFYANVLTICYNKLFKFIYVLHVSLNNYERSKNWTDNFKTKLLWTEEFNSLRWQVYMYNEIFPNVNHIEKAKNNKISSEDNLTACYIHTFFRTVLQLIVCRIHYQVLILCFPTRIFMHVDWIFALCISFYII